MANFMIRFLICNIFISAIIGILLIVKWIFKKSLSSRMQYNLWFLLLGLLVVPFIPFRFIRLPQMISYLNSLKNSPASNTATMMGETTGANLTENENWMNNFALSVSSVIPSRAGYIFFLYLDCRYNCNDYTDNKIPVPSTLLAGIGTSSSKPESPQIVLSLLG